MSDLSTALAEFNACIDHDKANQDKRIEDAQIVTELNAAIENNHWPMLSPEQSRRVLQALLANA